MNAERHPDMDWLVPLKRSQHKNRKGNYVIVYKPFQSIVYTGKSEVSLYDRWKTHRNTCKFDYQPGHDNPLYKAMRKYGLENFQMYVVMVSEDLNAIAKKENECFHRYGGFDKLYNLVEPDTEWHGLVLGKEVCSINVKTLRMIAKYESYQEAGRQNKVNGSAIRLLVEYGSGQTVKGMYWALVEDYESGNWTPPPKKPRLGLAKLVGLEKEDGSGIERIFKSTHKAAKVFEVADSVMSRACRGEIQTIKGRKFVYLKEVI